MYLRDMDTAMKVWRILEAVDWKWTITQVLEQPADLLNEILTIASLSRNPQFKEK